MENNWKIVINVLEPTGIDSVTYDMIKTDVVKPNATSNVYYLTTNILVYPEHPNPKASKYQFIITHTDEDGNVKTKTHQIIRQIGDGNMEITISTWLDNNGNLVSFDSTSVYTICDVNWTSISHINSKNTYFNVYKDNIISAIRNLNLGSSTTQYLTGGNSTYTDIFLSDRNVKTGVNFAEFDYTTSSLTISQVSEMDVYIKNFLPFVSPVDIVIPDGIRPYEINNYENGVFNLSLVSTETIPANTPIILKSDEEGKYTLKLNSDFKGTTTNLGNRTIIEDVVDTSGMLCGVFYPHLLSTNDYIFNGDVFGLSPNGYIIEPFNCYFKLSDNIEEPEKVTFNFEDSDGSDNSDSSDSDDSEDIDGSDNSDSSDDIEIEVEDFYNHLGIKGYTNQFGKKGYYNQFGIPGYTNQFKDKRYYNQFGKIKKEDE